MIEFIAHTGQITDAYKRHCMIGSDFSSDDQYNNQIRFGYVQRDNNGFMLVRGQKEYFKPEYTERSRAVTFNFKNNQQVCFFIRLTPSIKKSVPSSSNGQVKTAQRVVPITRHDEIVGWYRQQLLQQGAKLSEIQLLQHTVAPCSKNWQVFNEVFTYVEATVLDSSKFTQYAKQGGGKRKSFGYGLPILEGTAGYHLTQLLFQEFHN